jgi:hypothetical protein
MIFPSPEHREQLARQVTDIGLGALHDEDRRQWHAYDYAWRRVRLSRPEPASPIDPEGRWYHAQMVNLAVPMFEPKPRYQSAPEPVTTRNPELNAHFRRQDRERAGMKAMIAGSGKNPEGSPTEDAVDFVDLCMLQIRENLDIVGRRHEKVFGVFNHGNEAENRDALEALQAELSVKVAS